MISQTTLSLPGPHDTTRIELPNGITILTRANFNSASVVGTCYLPAGISFYPPEILGLAYFTALALMRGTQQHNFQQLYDSLESVGANLGFSASVHNITFGGRCLAEDLPLLLTLLSETLRTPTFPCEQVERLRAQMLTRLAIRAQDTADMASITFDRLLFPNHPYGLPEDGYPETIQRIECQDLNNFHQHHVGPRGMVLVIVGGITAEQAIEGVTQALGDWQNPAQPTTPSLPTILPPQHTTRQHIPLPGKSQSDLVMGCLGPRRNAPNYLAASLGNNILGQFGMMGRIGDVVREQAGLAYHAATSLNAWIESGSWEVEAGVNPFNLQRAIDLITFELGRFVQEPVTREELADSQSNFIGRLPLSLESNGGVAGALLTVERFQLGLDYFVNYAGRVRSITPEDILEAAQSYINPQALIIVSAGPDQTEDA